MQSQDLRLCTSVASPPEGDPIVGFRRALAEAYVGSRAVDIVVRVLGPLEVLIDGVDVTPPAPKERALLALLVVGRGRAVGADQLMEELWPTLDADRARRVLQVRVAALRKLLGTVGAAPLLELVAPGYRLTIADEDVDEQRFFELVEQARRHAAANDPTRASATLRDALGLWRGQPLADVQTSVSLEAEAARLDDARLDAIEDRIDADLACGRHHAVACELDSLVATDALRERLWGQRVLALYRCGRQSEALRACALVRSRLFEELGVEPGPALRALEAAVLEQRAELDWSALPMAEPTEGRPRPSGRTAGRARPDHRAKSSRRAVPSIPEIHYVKSGDGVNLAYQVVGEGPVDLIVVPGQFSHLETWWAARSGRFVRRLASFSRLILFDKRGMGLSDRPPEVNVDRWVEDATVVLDAVGSERAAVFGVGAGGLIAIPFAASYPARVRALVLYGSFARQNWGEDYPIGHRPEDVDAHIAYTEPRWGSGVGLRLFCPSASDDQVAREQFGRFQRASASPGAAAAYLRTVAQIDVRRALPMVEAPTLVLHARRDRVIPIELAHYMAERMPHATLAEVDSADHLIWFSDAVEAVADQIQDFLIGAVPNREIRRVLATVVCIVGLHPRPGPLAGARAYAETKTVVGRFRGRIVRHDAGGILATFDGPARAVRCASELVAFLWPRELSVRVGVHSGECDATSTGVSGVAVDIARGVADLARPGEVLVSQTVRDLVLGSSITFRDPCSHELRDVPGRWRVFAVRGI